MKTRSASESLKGYFYQFDKTILTLLNADSTSTVTVEGIEDIDIENPTLTTAIQCKYLESKTFVNSAIRKPIQLMLDHYAKNSQSFNYNLYAHFPQEAQREETIDIDRLKEILTYIEDGKDVVYHRDNNLKDETLRNFLKVFRIKLGPNYEEQKKEVFSNLKQEFSCSDMEVEEIYYNKALRYISDLAVETNISKRKTTKQQLIDYLNCKELLFNRWFFELKGKEAYIKLTKKHIKTASLLKTQKEKSLFISDESLTMSHSLAVDQLIKNIIDKHFKLNKSLRDTKPWTIIFDIEHKKLLEVKKALIKDNIKFNNGYEEIEFNSSIFNERPVINTSKSDKIVNASFVVKIISAETYKKNRNQISSTDIVFFCSTKSPNDFFEKDINLIQINMTSLEDINDIINSN